MNSLLKALISAKQRLILTLTRKLEPHHFKVLRTPLYWLYSIRDLERYEGFMPSRVSEWLESRPVERNAALLSALRWAAENPDFDFRSLLPDLKPSNAEIAVYLRSFLAIVETSLATQVEQTVSNEGATPSSEPRELLGHDTADDGAFHE